MPELELERTADSGLFIDFTQFINDVECMIHVALMVVGQVVSEQAVEIKVVHENSPRFVKPKLSRWTQVCTPGRS